MLTFQGLCFTDLVMKEYNFVTIYSCRDSTKNRPSEPASNSCVLHRDATRSHSNSHSSNMPWLVTKIF